MGDGTEQNPYTREDVLKLIEENDGKAEGLDLSGKIFEDGINLSGLDLKGIILKEIQCLPVDWALTMLDVLLEENVLSNADPKKLLYSGAHFEKSRLSYAHLEGANLPFSHFEHCDLSRAHLEGAELAFAFLQGASLIDAHLEGARLSGAFLEGAALGLAHLEGASLGGAKFSDDTNLEGVDWGNYILGEEKRGAFPLAAETYRRLKQWYTNAGMYDVAGEFFFREMTAKRKNLRWGNIPKNLYEMIAYLQLEQALENSPNDTLDNIDVTSSSLFEILNKFRLVLFPKKPFSWAWSKLISLLCGYGERPWRVVTWSILWLFGLALLYFLLQGVAPYNFSVQAFLSSLYYSAVSFTALGYGPWFNANSVHDWVQSVGVIESFIGVFSIALFLITFTRKMTR